MSRKRVGVAAAALAALALATALLWPSRREEPGAPVLAERVRLDSPSPGDTVTSPLVVRGAAPGPWFFEASFPVRLLEAGGDAVADTFAEAGAEWMTEELVPFRAVLVFPAPPSARGTLVFERANPSGLPEHAAAVRIPVVFTPADAVQIFFPNSNLDPGQRDCRRVFPVERRVPADRDPRRAALEALLAGPDPGEREAGYLTALPGDAALRSVTVSDDGVARADFDERLEAGVAGSCRVLAIRAQIEETLRRLPGVRRVVVSVDGRTEEILQP